MTIKVTMPQMGESVYEGTLTKWLKKAGDTVTRDEPLFEISTDKVDSEIPSPASGILSEILVPEGHTVKVDAVLATIKETGEEGASLETADSPHEVRKAKPPEEPVEEKKQEEDTGGELRIQPAPDKSEVSASDWKISGTNAPDIGIQAIRTSPPIRFP